MLAGDTKKSQCLHVNEGPYTPTKVSAPSCIVPLAEDVVVKPYLVPLFSTFHGMETENSYTHIWEFEEVFTTFVEGAIDMDLLKLKALISLDPQRQSQNLA